MVIKLNNIDVLQIAKALKSGWLDLSKIESFKSLIDGYNPPKKITRDEMDYYLDCLYKGWGYVPTDKEQMRVAMLQGFDGELLEQWQSRIEDDSLYRQMIKCIFIGLVAMRGLGGTSYNVEPDFSFTEKKLPKFGNI